MRHALRNPAVNLPVHQHLVEHRPAVIDRDVAHQVRRSRLNVDLDNRDVTSEREGLIVLVEVGLGDQRHVRGQVRPAQRGRRDAFDAEAPVHELDDVFRARFQPPGRLLPRFVHEQNASRPHGAAADLQRPRTRRSTTSRDQACVRLHHADLVHRHAEAFDTPFSLSDRVRANPAITPHDTLGSAAFRFELADQMCDAGRAQRQSRGVEQDRASRHL